MNIQSFSQVNAVYDYKATINSEMVNVERSAQQVHTDVEASQSSYNHGQTMSFQFPTGMNLLLDCERTTLYFNVQLRDEEGTDANKSLSLADDASSLFDTVEVFVNNVSLGPLNNYNLLKSIMNGLTVTDEVRSGPLAVYGGFNQTTAPGATTYATRSYAVQLTLDGLFGKTSRLLPLFLLSNVELRIRLAQPHVCVVRSATTQDPVVSGIGYTVSNAVMRCFGKQTSDIDRNLLTQQFLKEGLQILTTSFEHYPVSWSGAANSSVSIDTRKQSVKSAMVVFRKNDLMATDKVASVTTAGTNSIAVGQTGNKLNSFVGDITKYYIQIGSDRVPANFDIDTKQMQLFEAHTALHGQIVGYRVKPSLWTTGNYTSCVIARDFETTHTGSVIAGSSNMSRQRSDIKIRILETNGSPSGLVGDAFVHYDKLIYVSPRGAVKIVE
jgi:hypothetical protein